MKPPVFAYYRPRHVQEAVELKERYAGAASVLAGGQSLMPMLNFRIARPSALIDLSGIPDLDYTFLDEAAVLVGAMRRQRDLELDANAVGRCPLLADALRNVAHPVIRNRGTVGGTVAHADASAELPAVLVALGGHVCVASPDQERTIAAEDFFQFHLTTSLEDNEIVTAVAFPNLPRGSGTSFLEFARRHGDYALVGVCVMLCKTDDGRLKDVRIGYSGIAPTPVRARAAEAALEGNSQRDESLEEAGQLAAELVDCVDEEQVSVAYRQQLVRVLTKRAVACAAGQAGML